MAGFIGSPPMNFMPATVEGNSLKLPFGTVEIPAAKAEKAAGKGLLIAGVRPEHFEDASVVRGGASGDTFRAKVDVVEWLGNEAYAYIPFEVEAELRAELDQLERDLEGEGTRTQLVVSLDGASQIQEGDEAEIWVDADADPPLRPVDRREPHGGPLEGRPDPEPGGHGGRGSGLNLSRPDLSPRSQSLSRSPVSVSNTCTCCGSVVT